MKILFVANRVPFPPFRGDKLKIYNLAKNLHIKHEIHLITIAESRDDLKYYSELKALFTEVTILYLPKWRSFLNTLMAVFSKIPFQVAYFKFSEFDKKLSEILEHHSYDGIHVQHLRMSRFFLKRNRKNVVLDLPDAFSLYWKRRSENAKSFWMKWFAKKEFQRLTKYEQKTLPLFYNLVCSPEDQTYLSDKTGATVDLLPNGVDVNQFSPKGDVDFILNRILFAGNMDYEPNVDAVEYFVKDIFPKILNRNPMAKFVIAGQRPVKRVQKLASSNVIITGFVEDISLEYAKAAVVVAPLRFGAGTQNKVLEAMAMEVPVVCTNVGFKGLGVDSGQGAVLAETTEDFCREVLQILENKEYRYRIVFAGRNIIQSKFGWKAISQKLEQIFKNLQS